MPAAPPILGSTGSTTVVLVVLLVALGVIMIVAARWLAHATRTDTRALGPLEVMGDRRFTRRDADARAAALAAARPEGALGPAPMVAIDGAATQEPAAEVAAIEAPTLEPDEPVEADGEPAEAAPRVH